VEKPKGSSSIPQLETRESDLEDHPSIPILRGRAEIRCPTEFSGSCYPVWFGTNRKPIDPQDYSKGFTNKMDNLIHYGKRVVYIPEGRKEGTLGSRLWERLLGAKDTRIKLAEAYQFDESGFAKDVRSFLSQLDRGDHDVLVFIHGFDKSFDDAARRAAQLGFDLKVPGITVFFSWPSQARWDPLGYNADRTEIENSEEQIAQFLVTVAKLTDRGRVHIIAHSMGNYGLLRALEGATARAQILGKIKFGQIFLSAPDVDVQLFRRLATVYPQISERTTLYITDKDKALHASEWFSGDERVGALPPVTILNGIDTVQVRGSANPFFLGHGYVAQSAKVLQDLSTMIYFREPPQKRQARNKFPIPDETEEGKGSWIIRD
jgi:esterase/lipase superfamily enzyme